MRAGLGVIWAAISCSRVDPAEHAALEEKVEHMQRRLDALEQRAAKAEAEAEVAASPVAPETTTSPELPRRDTLTIALRPDGVAIDGRLLEADALDDELRRHVSAQGITPVLIDADPSIAHSRVIALIDRVRSIGGARFAIARKGGTPSPDVDLGDDSSG
jgi:biopolymer transport protein ExbD